MTGKDDKLKYTENMEKGLRQNHGIGHEKLNSSLDKKIEVEKSREKDHKQSQKIEREISNDLHHSRE
ncbi:MULTISPECIES: hypothetical protein [Alteribacter]|uniref:Uncharacterized protein n=1 Tax=Alteribacter keqinensis TaxID=2483800 RepID=A0A3M7TPS7_9BACI|nr:MULTISPECIES: hypothetical protein [Alteribacter]MBM7096758.1 hypothetical protein [Alteribacter salitolerans]RNA66296.1 hypothetical protein EBO34_19450 [Alteribacter keqinensis]